MSPLNRPPLPLEPEPRSVREAREWVTKTLTQLDREDLIETAQLGVSELVTNAILHGQPPIRVRVRGTARHPRVEVHDTSPHPPTVNDSAEIDGEDRLLTTIGRGLDLVALSSASCGAEVRADGKVVWFEPLPETDADGTAARFTLEFLDEPEPAPEPGDHVQIRLLHMPVQEFARFRSWFMELRRELRLLALAHGDDYPVAKQLSELTLQSERERHNAFGLAALEEAIAEGKDHIDVTYEVPESTPSTMGRLREVLERADEFCREQRLLSLAGTPEQLALQRWYLGEFVRQGSGEPPLPWPGTLTVDESD